MPNSELANMLRSIIQEELQPVRQEFQEFRQEVKTRLDTLDKGQKKLQRDVTLIRKELKESWKDIGNFDDRITNLEKMVIR
ncbi:hypothetical protein Dtox_3669 [Desulfofarcimen acetoxidans DSM 771]|uniref:Uncharacterized protein n=1 Tax=Desulfofarcimen acetoxidans (strain ATCC 49208 / DSM 771 / KCTC 5769 / VKM B-1644 / 5575) TaxID=485916 RepID=C8VWL4_DESAS|nr:hypothetical protein [Desulfofarcimen acetoxidans]ACV64378.1 hypothetical protein Dtox_3669 [Desulfofarcimen acetoxidans DSM 771]